MPYFCPQLFSYAEIQKSNMVLGQANDNKSLRWDLHPRSAANPVEYEAAALATGPRRHSLVIKWLLF